MQKVTDHGFGHTVIHNIEIPPATRTQRMNKGRCLAMSSLGFTTSLDLRALKRVQQLMHSRSGSRHTKSIGSSIGTQPADSTCFSRTATSVPLTCNMAGFGPLMNISS